MLQTILNNRYQIIKELGCGGFGTTYLAKDIQASEETFQVDQVSEATVFSSSLCAIKQLNPKNADIETAKRLFKREANILVQLQEVAGVPKFIDYFEENNHHYIVEEYIKGTSLDSLLGEKWSSQQVVIFLWDTLSILQKLHEKNIIHRDIKPSNLILKERDSKLTIIDFGAVKELKQSQVGIRGTGIISPGYAPPEQQTGTPQLNSDIYALGMTAIQLLTKTHPKDVIKDENDNVVWTTNVNLVAPKFLTDILNTMIKNKYQERYQSVEEILRDLQVGGPQPPPQPPPPESPKRFWYIPLLLATIVIVGSEMIYPWIRPWYYLAQGNSLLDKNHPKPSLSEFQKAIDLKRNSSAAWKGKGDALFIMGRYLGALEAYKKAIALEPNNLKALNNIGKILHKQGEFQQAINVYQQAIKIDSNHAAAWSGQGLAYMSRKQYEKAKDSFDKAQSIKPEDPTIWIQKGIVLIALKRLIEANMFYQEALDVYDEITAKDKNNPLLWTDRGFVLLQLNRPQDAFASYDKALMLDSNFYEALMGKANAFNAVKDYEQALLIFDRAKEIRPKDYQVWYNRGNLLLQALNNPTEAFTSFERATDLNPGFYPAWLRQGLSLNALEQYEDAKVAFNTAKELNPQDPYVWLNLGIALEELGELKTACDAYKRAAIELNFPPAKEHMERLCTGKKI